MYFLVNVLALRVGNNQWDGLRGLGLKIKYTYPLDVKNPKN
jgi:hypothetical protein